MILWKGRGIECFKKDKKCCIVGGLSIVCYYGKKLLYEILIIWYKNLEFVLLSELVVLFSSVSWCNNGC